MKKKGRNFLYSPRFEAQLVYGSKYDIKMLPILYDYKIILITYNICIWFIRSERLGKQYTLQMIILENVFYKGFYSSFYFTRTTSDKWYCYIKKKIYIYKWNEKKTVNSKSNEKKNLGTSLLNWQSNKKTSNLRKKNKR